MNERVKLYLENKQRNKVLCALFTMVGAFLLMYMHGAQMFVPYYELPSGGANPFNYGLQWSVLYGIFGTILIFLAGCILKKGKRRLSLTAIVLAFFDLGMYASLMKSSVIYLNCVYEIDYKKVWTFYYISSVVVVLLLSANVVFFLVDFRRKRKVMGIVARSAGWVLIAWTLVDMVSKSFTNPWYIYCVIGTACACILSGVMYKVVY